LKIRLIIKKKPIVVLYFLEYVHVVCGEGFDNFNFRHREALFEVRRQRVMNVFVLNPRVTDIIRVPFKSILPPVRFAH
jgi:hypothetical protein